MDKVGYTPDGFVWVIDRTAGMAYPAPKNSPFIAAYPERYELDAKHPVTDHRGVLLPAKPIEAKASKTTKPAAAGKEN